ncbi:MAG: glycosyltransferase family 39 protein [Candidatus Daviesbacteria bacterium]|nr:glycosyltransferase family 39 protein [Candidatus Daviesbacteria bacterium]
MKRILFYSGILLISILPLIISFNLLYLKDPPIWPDEPVFYDMAKNLTTNNSLATRIYVGTTSDVKNTGLGYPPLYFYTLSFFTDTFGSDIEMVRNLSLIFGIFCLVTFFFLVIIIFENKYLALLGTIILSLDIFFARSSRTGRMEISTFFFM